MEMIEAEEGNEFQDFVFLDNSKVPPGTEIGVEVVNPRTKRCELKLFDDIRYKN